MRYIQLSDWTKHHEYPSVSQFRYLLQKNKDKNNGLNKVVKKIGGKILVNEGAFFEWIDKQNYRNNDV